MKKHPVIHYILILVLSGSFGALLSFLMMHNEETLVSSIQTFKTWFGETSAILHIAVCGVLALVSFLCLRRTRKMLSRLTPETEDEIMTGWSTTAILPWYSASCVPSVTSSF